MIEKHVIYLIVKKYLFHTIFFVQHMYNIIPAPLPPPTKLQMHADIQHQEQYVKYQTFASRVAAAGKYRL